MLQQHLKAKAMPARLASITLAALMIFLMPTVPGHAQLAGRGQISGTVMDSSGAAIPNAKVTITNANTGISINTTSTSSGDYAVPTLDPGKYTVTVTADGFQKLSQQNIQVNALESQTFNPKLTVGSTTEVIEVTTAPPMLETSNATLGATMEQEMYSALPIEMGAYNNPDQRRATDFAYLMPGVQGNNTNGNPTTNTGIVNGSGSRGAVSSAYIDGVNFVRAGGNGDPRYIWTAISVDAINQFQVQTTGYSAQYEGQGVQNYTIKQGGSAFHGAVYDFFRNTALDTWGFYKSKDPISGALTKRVEHMNEYGINISGPLIPVGKWKEKLFFFGNYNGYRYSSTTPQLITFPTTLQQGGNFQGVVSGGIYDPNTQTACTANSTDGPCRYRYGYIAGSGKGARGNPIVGPGGAGGVDVIPAAQFSQAALQMESVLKTLPLTNQNNQNNYLAPNPTALTNWSHTERIDYNISSRDQLSFMAAIGRQASSTPVGQAANSGRNVARVPYNYGQAYAPKTAVGVIEETHTFSPHIVNQIKYGYARYDGPTINADNNAGYGASSFVGLSNIPGGQASTAFPITTFSGTNAPTGWGGATASRAVAENYTLVDNLNWNFGSHSILVGTQFAWMLYNNIPATTGATPVTLANSVNETAQFNASTNNSYAITTNTGVAYASFLIGQIDKSSYTTYLNQDFGSRFLAISPYIQDTWKATKKLSLDMGLRWDYWPSFREAHDSWSFFDQNLTNPVTGQKGALNFAGTGTNTCNCRTQVDTYLKHISPRLGLAYQLDDKTVLRASYGVIYTHGGAVGGGAASQGGGSGNSLGFSSQANFSATGQFLSTSPLTGSNKALPTAATAQGRASGPAFGTGYTTSSGYTGTPSSMAILEPYLGSRAPQYLNYSVGLQHQWNDKFTTTISYVGSQGHFLGADGSNGRGYYADQLDPKYLNLGSNLNLTGSALTNYCAANNSVCPSYYNVFNTSQSLATLLKPFPFQTVTDATPNVSNTNYNSLQTVVNMRVNHGFTILANYTWSHAIDNAGTFRSGYAIPGSTMPNGQSYRQGLIERSASTSNQPHHGVLTGVWDLPFGKTVLAEHYWERAVIGGFRFSTIFQAFSGSPLAITGSSCATNPAMSTCMPNLNAAFSGPARINGKWGAGALGDGSTSPSYIDSNAFVTNNAYQFGNAPRTHAYGLTGPGNYDLDISLRRSFHIPVSESTKLSIQGDLYNVTNHTQFTVASAVWGNSSFGKVNNQANAPRQAQLSARFEW